MRSPAINDIPAPFSNKIGWPWTDDGKNKLSNTMLDGRSWPRISIVTPSFNQGQYIEETIRSILLQRYPNLEYIIIDGGSSDETVDIIRKYEPWLAYWVSEKDQGQSHAINKGFMRATGVVGNWINADDCMCPNALAAIAMATPAALDDKYIIGGNGEIIDENGQFIRAAPLTISQQKEPFSFSLAFKGSVQPAYFFSLNLFREVGGVDISLHYVMDTDIYCRFGLIGYKEIVVPSLISRFRKQKMAKSNTLPFRMTLENLQLFRKYCEIEPDSKSRAMFHIAKRILQSDFTGASIKDKLSSLLFVAKYAPQLLLGRRALLHQLRWILTA